jgi:hypothetical protein
MARKKASKDNNCLTLRERSSILVLDRSSTKRRLDFDSMPDTQDLLAQQKEEFERTVGSIELIYGNITQIKHSNPKTSSPQHLQIQRCCSISIEREVCPEGLGKAFSAITHTPS